MTPRPDTAAAAEAATWARAVGLTDAVHLVTPGSVNLHLRGRLAGRDVFVKVYAVDLHGDAEIGYLSRTSSSLITAVAYGEHDGRRWVAMPYVPLTAVPQPVRPAGLADALADIHAQSHGNAPRRPGVVDAVTEARALARRYGRDVPADLPAVDVAVEAQLRHAAIEEWAAAPVLLHGDVWAGNLVSIAGGPPTFIDFERVQVGAPEWDLATVWDTDLGAPDRRSEFVAAYRACGSDDAFPRSGLLDAVRLVCAWRGLAHAGRYGAPALQALSEQVTAALAEELLGG